MNRNLLVSLVVLLVGCSGPDPYVGGAPPADTIDCPSCAGAAGAAGAAGGTAGGTGASGGGSACSGSRCDAGSAGAGQSGVSSGAAGAAGDGGSGAAGSIDAGGPDAPAGDVATPCSDQPIALGIVMDDSRPGWDQAHVTRNLVACEAGKYLYDGCLDGLVQDGEFVAEPDCNGSGLSWCKQNWLGCVQDTCSGNPTFYMGDGIRVAAANVWGWARGPSATGSPLSAVVAVFSSVQAAQGVLPHDIQLTLAFGVPVFVVALRDPLVDGGPVVFPPDFDALAAAYGTGSAYKISLGSDPSGTAFADVMADIVRRVRCGG